MHDNGTKETETYCLRVTPVQSGQGATNFGFSLQSPTSGSDEFILALGWKTPTMTLSEPIDGYITYLD